MLKLFYAPGACSLAPHIVLEEIGAPFELGAANAREGAQRSPAYLSVNPKGRVPALATDRGRADGKPGHPGISRRRDIPRRVSRRSTIHSPSAKHAGLQRVPVRRRCMSLSPTPSGPERYADGAAAAQAMRAKAPQALAAAFALVEETFADGRPYVLSENYSVADAYLSVFSRWLEGRGLGRLKDFPKTAAHLDKVSGRPAVKRALRAEATM